LVEKHLAECQEAQKVIGEIDAKKDGKIICGDDENSLKDKGYSEGSISKIRS